MDLIHAISKLWNGYKIRNTEWDKHIYWELRGDDKRLILMPYGKQELYLADFLGLIKDYARRNWHEWELYEEKPMTELKENNMTIQEALKKLYLGEKIRGLTFSEGTYWQRNNGTLYRYSYRGEEQIDVIDLLHSLCVIDNDQWEIYEEPQKTMCFEEAIKYLKEKEGNKVKRLLWSRGCCLKLIGIPGETRIELCGHHYLGEKWENIIDSDDMLGDDWIIVN